MKKIMIIGATSAIAESCATLWAKEGCIFFLVGRSQVKIDQLTKKLIIQGAIAVSGFILDINDFEKHQKARDTASDFLGSIDIVLIAHGNLPDQKRCTQSVDLTLREISTNALSTVSFLTITCKYMKNQQKGTISLLSSVAGDRGRGTNYIYGSAKGMLNIFCEGMRQELNGYGVKIVTIKLGFVNTPMTLKFKKGILWRKPQDISKTIITIINHGNGEYYVPGFWRAIMWVIKIIPNFIFYRIKI